MRVIDLLNKIANGELETFYKFKYRNKIVTMSFLIDNYLFLEILNDEIEFIEDEIEEEKKIPEKLEKKLIYTREPNGFEHPDSELPSKEEMFKKINEIVDYLDYLKSKGDE